MDHVATATTGLGSPAHGAIGKFEIIVAATAADFGIGYNDTIPWKIPEDMKHFRTVTTSVKPPQSCVIMGRRTWESLPASACPLPHRRNLVLSRGNALQLPVGVDCAKSFGEALDKCRTWQAQGVVGQVFVIGGAQLYEEAIAHPDCTTVRLTLVTAPEFRVDVTLSTDFQRRLGWFTGQPPVTQPPAVEFELVSVTGTSVHHPPFPQEAISYNFAVYSRRPAAST